jgi:hypothetical protein
MADFSKIPLLRLLHVCLCRLSEVFGDRIISSGICPARSPNLNPSNFFFWDCLKDKIYNINLWMEKELKENICREITIIPA